MENRIWDRNLVLFGQLVVRKTHLNRAYVRCGPLMRGVVDSAVSDVHPETAAQGLMSLEENCGQ